MDLKIIYHNIYLPTQQGQIIFCQKIGKNSIAKKKLIIFFTIHFLQKKMLQYFLQFSFSNFYMMWPLIIFLYNLAMSVSSKIYKIFFKPITKYTEILMKTFDLWSIHECNERENTQINIFPSCRTKFFLHSQLG